MMLKRGVKVDHRPCFVGFNNLPPEIEKRMRWYNESGFGESSQVDETYVKVKGKRKYLYRAITKSGKTLEFYLSHNRNTKAAKRFLGKILRKMKEYENPATVNTDKAPSYDREIRLIERQFDIYSAA